MNSPGVEGEWPCTDIMDIHRPDDLVDVANLGLTLAEAKRLLAGVQREIVAAQARNHAASAAGLLALWQRLPCEEAMGGGRRGVGIIAGDATMGEPLA